MNNKTDLVGHNADLVSHKIVILNSISFDAFYIWTKPLQKYLSNTRVIQQTSGLHCTALCKQYETQVEMIKPVGTVQILLGDPYKTCTCSSCQELQVFLYKKS